MRRSIYTEMYWEFKGVQYIPYVNTQGYPYVNLPFSRKSCYLVHGHSFHGNIQIPY